MRTLRNVNMYVYLFRCMSRLGMLIRVTARAVLSIEWGGQFCGPRCTWCSSLCCRSQASSLRSSSLSAAGCLERLVATDSEVKTRLGHAQSTVGWVGSVYGRFTIMASRIAVSV